MRKILFLTNTGGYGGTEKHLIELIRRLDSRREAATILCLRNDPYTEHLNRSCGQSVRILWRPRHASFWDWLRMFRETRPDLAVFVHGGLFVFPWFAYLAGRVAGVPRIASIHHAVPAAAPAPVEGRSLRDVWRRLAGWRVRYLLGLRLPGVLSNKVICVSEATRAQLIREYRYPENKTVVIHNGVDLAKFSPATNGRLPFRQTLGLSAEDTLVVCVSRLSMEKGLDVLLQAMTKLARENPSCKCIIVGDGPLKKDLCDSITALGLDSRVLLVGFQADVVPYLQAGDIFVLPSNQEALPLALLEAMACGLPCVVTDVGGTAEVVTNGREGVMVRQGSADELAQAIAYLLVSPQERQRMAAAALSKVRECFDLNHSIARLTDALLEDNIR